MIFSSFHFHFKNDFYLQSHNILIMIYWPYLQFCTSLFYKYPLIFTSFKPFVRKWQQACQTIWEKSDIVRSATLHAKDTKCSGNRKITYYHRQLSHKHTRSGNNYVSTSCSHLTATISTSVSVPIPTFFFFIFKVFTWLYPAQ